MGKKIVDVLFWLLIILLVIFAGGLVWFMVIMKDAVA